MVAQNNPIQSDAFSCGVYVCWMFIRHTNHGLWVEMHATALPRRRFELFFYLKTARLFTLDPSTTTESPDDDTEENPPPTTKPGRRQ
ncbi:hypothetical protein PHMEG_00038564 [Phytophthora megakarya]|uniref:Ubiquitin-like protease family profile domain-containing protein n=1 Tax=Phytophthora megakarya TaxID=4795 RepID=A0A225UH75_9STRA|nr:hypothetical protein PHMEG_00038564 [Phytophthora megakarya]